MSMGLAGKWEQRLSLKWVWPLNLAKYDQAPTLRKDERTTIENMFEGARRREFAREPWRTQLSRLLTPILDTLKLTGASRETLGGVVSVLLNEMWCRNSSYWSWKESDWESMLRISTRTHSRVHGVRGDARSHLLAFALLLRRIHDPRQCGEFDRILLAKRIFGEASVEASASRVAETVKHWGFSDQLNQFRQFTALCEVLLVNGSPLLEDLTTEVLEKVWSSPVTTRRRWCVQRLSSVLADLGLIQRALPHGYSKARGGRPST